MTGGRPRVTFLTPFFPPEVGAIPTRIHALARGLARRGAAVTVHTGFPHYPDGRIKVPYANRPLVRERIDEVSVIRSALYPAPNRGFGRRLVSQGSFAAWAVAVAPLAPPADVVIVQSPPLVLGAAGIAYAAIKRAPYVLHVSDLYPDSAIELGVLRDPLAIRAARRLEDACYRRAAAVTAPTEGIVERLARRPAPPERVRQMPPLVELERFDPRPRLRDGPLRVLYAGAIGLAHRVQTLVEAAVLAGSEAVELWIAGDGEQAQGVRDCIAASGAHHVRMLGLVPAQSVPALYRAADVAAVVLRDRPVLRSALPTKLFEAMAAARTIVLSGAGEAARLVEHHGVGWVVAPEDPVALAGAFTDLARAQASVLAAHGARGRRLAESYSVEHAVDRWSSLLSDLAVRPVIPRVLARDPGAPRPGRRIEGVPEALREKLGSPPVTSSPSSTHVSPAPLSVTLEEACRRWRSRPAITFEGTTITYEELWRQVMSLAGAYRELGVGRGDRVLCQLRNCPELIVATAAAWARGAVHVGADNDLTGPELARLVDRLGASALLFQPAGGQSDGFAPLRAVAGAFPQTRLIVHGPGAEPHQSLDRLLASDRAVTPEPPGPLDTALVFLTSGTTGEPKAVVEPLSAHWAKMQLFADAFRPGEGDVHLLYLPISHVFGSRLALLALLRGGHLVLLDRFSPARALELVERERVTVLPAVPTHLRLLREAYDPAHHDVSSLRWVLSAAAGLPRPLAEWVYTVLKAQITFVYGCSEGFTTVTTDPDEILAGSVGKTVFRGPPGTPADGTVRVVGEDGTPLPPGETGEIVYGAATPVRYWDHPDAASDGWYHTGDLGQIDGQGAVYVVGRLKELINRGGLHVSAAEVEMAVARHPEVADAGVIAAPHEVLGEAVCACVAPAAASPPPLAELRSFLADRLARHKLPDELCVVESIPRTDIGKVDRRALAASVIEGGAARERIRP